MKMDKTNRTELVRFFLFENLPEPLTRASGHLQIFDNYIQDTRIRLRSVRIPETREWIWSLEQRYPVHNGDLMEWKTAEIFLSEQEYHIFERFEGREIRKNRYFYEYDGRQLALDIYIGPLWGLSIMRAEFETIDEMSEFIAPPFTTMEISSLPLFHGATLVDMNFEQLRSKFAELVPLGQEGGGK